MVDPYANVRNKYRDVLDRDTAMRVASAASSMDLELLISGLGEFIATQLSEDHISATTEIKSVIGYIAVGDDFLVDIPWFVETHTHTTRSIYTRRTVHNTCMTLEFVCEENTCSLLKVL